MKESLKKVEEIQREIAISVLRDRNKNRKKLKRGKDFLIPFLLQKLDKC